MREFTAPTTLEVGEDDRLTDTPAGYADEGGSATLFRRREDGARHDVSAATFLDDVRRVAKGLLAAGVAHGDRVGLLAATRYEWTVIDYAIWWVGAATVPIYESSSAGQLQWILSDSAAVGLVVENDTHRGKLDKVRDECPDLAHVWQIDDGDDSAVDVLTAAGADVSDSDLEARRTAVGRDDLATLIYTSGTTGRPKGCELTHESLIAEARACQEAFGDFFVPGESTLMFLPLAHVFARAIAVGSIEAGVVVGHTADVKNLLSDLGEFQPSFILSVPRVFEKVYNGARQKAHSDGKGKIFDAAETTAVAWSKAQDTGGAGLVLKARHALFDRLVYSKLRGALGGRCHSAVAGGAPLGDRLGHFFRGIGVPVFEGYGLTETSAAATANTPQHNRVGTVGRAIPGMAIRIAEDSEVLIKGPVVFRRYWKNEEATAEALTDGWFHTGDLGSLDEDGFLRITGRKKEIIVTAGGKNVAPAVMEDKMRAHALISQCMVVGDQKPFIAALVTIDEEALPGWLERSGKPKDTAMADLVDDEALRSEVEKAVAEANDLVSKAEAIKKFRILAEDFTEDTGELTPTMKLKRNVVKDNHSDDIEALYAT